MLIIRDSSARDETDVPRVLKLIVAVLLITAGAAALAEEGEFGLVIENYAFRPSELVVPAGKRIKLIVENRDATPEEFDSHALNREKLVPGKSKAAIYIGPLKPGRYPFIGEFHDQTAKGTIIVQ